MFRSIAAAVIAPTTAAYKEPTQEERDSVKRWDNMMKYFGRDYEMYKANTDDGWTLTTFRVTDPIGKHVPRDESLNPVVLMNGS